MDAIRNFVTRFPLLTYFALVYAVSAAALIVLGLPRLDSGASQNPASLAVFPVLIISVAAGGAALTAAAGGTAALGALWSRMRLFRIRPALYLVLVVPPTGVLMTLLVFRLFVSPAFAPGFQLFGLPIGLVAGFFEEIGWTGFTYPRLRPRFGPVAGALVLGVVWGLWHLPVVDSLGAASPHGQAWPAFFAAFVALVAAVRCLISWAYSRTGSVLLAQLIHASFTGTLILFSAPHVTGWQEAAWYGVYACLLWLGLLVAFSALRAAKGAKLRYQAT